MLQPYVSYLFGKLMARAFFWCTFHQDLSTVARAIGARSRVSRFENFTRPEEIRPSPSLGSVLNPCVTHILKACGQAILLVPVSSRSDDCSPSNRRPKSSFPVRKYHPTVEKSVLDGLTSAAAACVTHILKAYSKGILLVAVSSRSDSREPR